MRKLLFILLFIPFFCEGQFNKITINEISGRSSSGWNIPYDWGPANDYFTINDSSAHDWVYARVDERVGVSGDFWKTGADFTVPQFRQINHSGLYYVHSSGSELTKDQYLEFSSPTNGYFYIDDNTFSLLGTDVGMNGSSSEVNLFAGPVIDRLIYYIRDDSASYVGDKPVTTDRTSFTNDKEFVTKGFADSNYAGSGSGLTVSGSEGDIQFNDGAGGLGSSVTFDFSTSNNNFRVCCRGGLGFSHDTPGANAWAIGEDNHSEGRASLATGFETWAEINHAFTQGFHTQASGISSFAGGTGVGAQPTKTGKEVIASGHTSFNFSRNDQNQTTEHGAHGNYSAILAGTNHNIDTSNVRSAIIAGDSIKLPEGGNYIDFVAIPNLAIWEEPSSGVSTDSILGWDPTTKKVRVIDQSKFVSGGGVTEDYVAQSIDSVDEATEISYTPTTGADWDDPDPTEVGGALDDLAADRISTNGLSIAIDTFNIGDWNMNSSASGTGQVTISISAGIDYNKVLNVQAFVKNDNDNTTYPIIRANTGGTSVAGAINYVSNVNTVVLTAFGSGFFDSTEFDATSYNRGWITIMYIE